ncbi:hypothetical protein DPMN_176710 [Dreissena polymorpha]|uniref:Uncharacterized protein n=1 Tax=Dreissena polymorpha TaxID=45954 RepID=A0A9D4IJH1_DREPO|nr:hypothetical protein DPMN_176710 [Dreissena polymorpha]
MSKESWLTQQNDGAIGSKRRWPSSIERARISLLQWAEAIVRKKTVSQVRNCKEA